MSMNEYPPLFNEQCIAFLHVLLSLSNSVSGDVYMLLSDALSGAAYLLLSISVSGAVYQLLSN